MTDRPLAFAVAAGLGLAVLGGGPWPWRERQALAQPSPETRASAAALFEDARRLMGEGKYPEACPKLEESQRIDPGMGTLYQLSVCYEQIGRTASAWVGFRDVAAQAAAAGQADREKAARGKASSLEPKLMRLKITVQPATASSGASVTRDGAVVSPALWGTAVPLDPGKHQVSAGAPGKEPWAITVQLDQPGGTVTVDVPPLLEKKQGGTVTLPVGPIGDRSQGGPVVPAPGTPPPIEGGSRRPWMLPLGITATAVGAVGLGVGTAFGLLAKSAFDASNTAQGTMPANCDKTTNRCNMAGLTQRSDAVSKGNIGTGVFIAGAVLAAGGIVVWIAAPSRAAKDVTAPPASPGPASPTPAVRPEFGLGPAGVAMRGVF